MLARMPSRICPALLALGLLAWAQVAATDQATAREWVASGRILPLAEILATLEREYDGRLLEAELEEEDDRPVYELEWLTPDGRVLEFEVDARDGTLLEVEEERD